VAVRIPTRGVANAGTLQEAELSDKQRESHMADTSKNTKTAKKDAVASVFKARVASRRRYEDQRKLSVYSVIVRLPIEHKAKADGFALAVRSLAMALSQNIDAQELAAEDLGSSLAKEIEAIAKRIAEKTPQQSDQK
jgi:predicted peptidase